MKKAVSIAILLSTVSAANLSHADTVKRSMPACISEELWDEFGNYVAKGDHKSASLMMINGQCFMLKQGEQISVISPGFMTATVRYKGVKLYTASEAVR